MSAVKGVGSNFPRDVALRDWRIGEEIAADVEVLRPLAALNHQRFSAAEGGSVGDVQLVVAARRSRQCRVPNAFRKAQEATQRRLVIGGGWSEPVGTK